jgi:hypothetical protein
MDEDWFYHCMCINARFRGHKGPLSKDIFPTYHDFVVDRIESLLSKTSSLTFRIYGGPLEKTITLSLTPDASWKEDLRQLLSYPKCCPERLNLWNKLFETDEKIDTFQNALNVSTC